MHAYGDLSYVSELYHHNLSLYKYFVYSQHMTSSHGDCIQLYNDNYNDILVSGHLLMDAQSSLI